MATQPVTPSIETQPQESVEERFRLLAAEWEQAVGHLSSMSARSKHPAYQAIIALGPEVVPLLLRDLEDNHTHWFNALQALTGTDPIPDSAAGNIPAMAEAWLNWARAQAYRWRAESNFYSPN